MSDRSRMRKGRVVMYYPTSAEVAGGATATPAVVIAVDNAADTVDVTLLGISSSGGSTISAAAPTAITAIDPTAVAATALGAFSDPPLAAEMSNLRTLINELLTTTIENRALALDLKARQAENRTFLVEARTDIGSGGGAPTRTGCKVGTGPGQVSPFGV